MTNRIFRSIFLTALVVLGSALALTVAVMYISFPQMAGGVIYAILLSYLVLLVAVLAFAFFVAKRLSVKLVDPINAIDPEHPDGAEVYAELRPIVDSLCRQKYRIAKQMEELSRRRNEFASITANMSDGIVVINSRGDILSYNRSAKEILGIRGEMPKSILAITMSHSLRMAVLSALSGEKGNDYIKREGRSYSILATPVMREEEAIDGALLVFLDTTERDEREELRREFTANVSHELKTPLTSISGFAELIRDGLAEGEDAKRFAGNIHKEAERLISLVGDIIRLAEVDGGEMPYDGVISASEVCKSVCERLFGVAEASGIKLISDIKEASILGNREVLEEMVYNLVDNGIKYTNEGGKVEVKVENLDTGARITVSDNGIGIPHEARERVFERFFRVDRSHSRSVGGTGLGLSIVKHAAGYHKAKITLESEPGVGTTVTVDFPRVK